MDGQGLVGRQRLPQNVKKSLHFHSNLNLHSSLWTRLQEPVGVVVFTGAKRVPGVFVRNFALRTDWVLAEGGL